PAIYGRLPRPKPRRAAALTPGPDVAVPDGRKDMERCALRTPVEDLDGNPDVVGTRLRIFDKHVEIAILGEDARVDQLEFRSETPAPPVFFHQVRVGKLGLRILVEALHVAVCGSGVEVEVALLDVFAMVALGSGKAEQALLEDRIPPIPQR